MCNLSGNLIETIMRLKIQQKVKKIHMLEACFELITVTSPNKPFFILFSVVERSHDQ